MRRTTAPIKIVISTEKHLEREDGGKFAIFFRGEYAGTVAGREAAEAELDRIAFEVYQSEPAQAAA